MKRYLRIEKPCNESLEKMHDVPEGKFCDLCSKKVIDFSVLSNSEISNFFAENRNNKICGIFFKSQLNPILIEENKLPKYIPRKTTFSKVAAGLALTASIVNSYPAQIKKSVNKEAYSPSFEKQNNQEKEKTDDSSFVISGKITSSEKELPLSAKVSFITALKVYSTKTDENGFYHLEVPKDILKYESLLEFEPDDFAYDRKLKIYTIENIGKKQLVKLDYNGLDKMYGEVSFGPPMATEKSFVILDGKRLNYKIFNKSYSLFSHRYDVHYISKDFVKFFTNKETIDDIFIVFIKPK